jgi:hypothetical protein
MITHVIAVGALVTIRLGISSRISRVVNAPAVPTAEDVHIYITRTLVRTTLKRTIVAVVPDNVERRVTMRAVHHFLN